MAGRGGIAPGAAYQQSAAYGQQAAAYQQQVMQQQMQQQQMMQQRQMMMQQQQMMAARQQQAMYQQRQMAAQSYGYGAAAGRGGVQAAAMGGAAASAAGRGGLNPPGQAAAQQAQQAAIQRQQQLAAHQAQQRQLAITASAGKGGAAGKGSSRPGVGRGGFVGCAVCASPVLPFGGEAKRSVPEFAARAPPGHRYYSPDLTSVTVHWVKEKANLVDGLRPAAPLHVATADDGVIEPTDPAEVAEKTAINARALLVGGVSKGASHVLRRLMTMAMKPKDKKTPQCYGGLVKKGSDKVQIAALAKLVKEQCGVDLSSVKKWHKIVEFTYKDKISSVFYMPDLKELGEDAIKVKPAEKELTEKYEVTERYEEEVEIEEEKKEEEKKEDDAEMKDEEKKEEGEEGEEKKEEEEKKPEKKTKKVSKTRKVEKERVKKDRHITPMLQSLSQVRESFTGPHIDTDTIEMYGAVTSLDEWLLRDSAVKVVEVLEEKREVAVKEAAERKEKDDAAKERKRKRDEEVEGVKKQRTESEAELKKKWEEEDAAETAATDEEKTATGTKRQEQLNEVAEVAKKALEEIDTKMKEEWEAIRKEAAEKDKKPEPEEGKPRTRTVRERNPEKYDLFQTFDRPKQGRLVDGGAGLNRDYLARVILALNDGKNLRACKDLTTLGKTVPITNPLDYGLLATVEREEEIPPSPVKSPVKEEAKEEAAEEAKEEATEEEAKEEAPDTTAES